MKLSFEQEKALCKAMLNSCGMCEEDAEILSASVAHSDFTGIYSHGLSRFSNYLKRFANGAMKADAKISVITDHGSTIAFDCDNGCGVIALAKAYRIMAERVKQYGIVIATGKRASNIGCGSFFGQMAAKDGLIGMFCCNTVRCVAPFGGADSFLGTNPIVVAAPANKERPLILDISTTVTAFGKVQAAAREGKAIPSGWALDREGRPTTDARAAKTVLPIAGPKGYGLAVMIEMFSALLADASYGDGIGSPNMGEHENTGFSMILVDPERFMPLEIFKNRVDDYILAIKAGKKAEGVSEIYLPGELEMRKFDSYMQSGYEISPALEKELMTYALSFGLAEENDSLETLIAGL